MHHPAKMNQKARCWAAEVVVDVSTVARITPRRRGLPAAR